MNRSRAKQFLPSFVLAVVAAAYVWIAYDYELGSRSLPWIAGVLAIVLVLIDVAVKGADSLSRVPGEGSADTGRQTAEVDEGSRPMPSARQELAAFAWIGAFLPLVVVLGFYGAIPLYGFCYLRLYAGKGGLVSAATAVGLVVCLYLVFEVFMGYGIFGGLLGGDSF